MPLLLSTVNAGPPNPPTLLVTGATASLRGSVRFATFAAGKFAQRAITQSLAREFGPQGVHVALAIIDGGIDTPWGRELGLVEVTKDSKLKPEAVSFLFLLSLSLFPPSFCFFLVQRRGGYVRRFRGSLALSRLRRVTGTCTRSIALPLPRSLIFAPFPRSFECIEQEFVMQW